MRSVLRLWHASYDPNADSRELPKYRVHCTVFRSAVAREQSHDAVMA